MTFFSLTFLLIFLPAGILLYYIVPDRFKNTVLLLLSLLFYWLLEPHFFWLMVGSVLFDYAAAFFVRFFRKQQAVGMLFCLLSAVKSVICLLYGMKCVQSGRPAPVGLWIYTLSATGYVIDLYRREAPFEHSLPDFLLYNCFLGRIFLGPYVKYTVIRPQLKKKRLSLASISSGMVLLMQGIAKKVVLGDSLMGLYQAVSAIEERERTWLSSWILLISLILGLYFVFSGYCDAARGLGHIFSFKMPRNVFFPLYARGIREFIERFNVTWMDYLRRQVFGAPVFYRGGVAGQCVQTWFCMLLYGLWLSFTPQGLLWGSCLALFILLEQYLYGRLLDRLPSLLSRLYTWLALLLSSTFLALPAGGWHDLMKTMFHFVPGLWYNDSIVYILSQNYWALALGMLLSYPIMPKISAFVRKKWPACADISSVVLNICLMVLTVMFLI